MQRSSITRYFKAVLDRSGIVGAARRMGGPNAHVLRILGYHSVFDSPDYCTPEICVSPKRFEQQLQHLARYYQVIGLDEAIDHLRADAPLPERAVVITFDDGYRDNYTHAFPLLRKFGMPATFFVVSATLHGANFWVAQLQRVLSKCPDVETLVKELAIPNQVLRQLDSTRQELVDHVSAVLNQCQSVAARQALLNRVFDLVGASSDERDSRPFMLTAREIQEMAAAGMSFGSHTVTHSVLTSLDERSAFDELLESKRHLEEVTGRPVRHFAHPNGHGVINYSQTTARLARQAGFVSACTSIRGMVDKSKDCFLLPRQNVNDQLYSSAFSFKLEEHRFPVLLFGT